MPVCWNKSVKFGVKMGHKGVQKFSVKHFLICKISTSMVMKQNFEIMLCNYHIEAIYIGEHYAYK
jgi:hypothetical protein